MDRREPAAEVYQSSKMEWRSGYSYSTSEYKNPDKENLSSARRQKSNKISSRKLHKNESLCRYTAKYKGDKSNTKLKCQTRYQTNRSMPNHNNKPGRGSSKCFNTERSDGQQVSKGNPGYHTMVESQSTKRLAKNKEDSELVVATFNCHGYDRNETIKILNDFDADIVILQETWKFDISTIQGYTTVHSSAMQTDNIITGRPFGGIGYYIKDNINF